MKSPEELMLEHLNGKFFWEHTVIQEEAPESKDIVAIRHAQKKFAKGSVNVTARNKDAPVPEKRAKIQRIPLRKDQKILEPVMNAIATAYEISVDDLFGRSTAKLFKQAKCHCYWAILKYNPSLTPSRAGDIMGKCRTTIMHGRTMFQKKQDFAKVVEVERLLGLIP